MSSTLILTIKSDETQALLQQLFQLDVNENRGVALALSGYFRDLASGGKRAGLDVQTGGAQPVRASGTFTFNTVIATDTFTIAGVTFTFTATPTLETDVDSAGTDAAKAIAAAAKINAHSTIGLIVKASAATNVVTVEALQAGVIGNQIDISDADTTIDTSAATLENGAGGATEDGQTYSLGLS